MFSGDSPEVPRRRESGVLVKCAPEILRYAQDDSQAACHPERSEGSLVDFWGITRMLIEGILVL
jgi:hypothetical protein